MIRKVQILDKWDDRLTKFRHKVMLENGAPEDYLDQSLGFRETESYLADKNVTWNEEIWKFSNFKWNTIPFYEIQAITLNDEVVCISGSQKYENGLLRVAMNHYTLKKARKECRYHLFKQEGLYEGHLKYAQQQGDINCLFITIYPHNKTLKNIVKNIGKRRFNPAPFDLPYMHKMKLLPQTMNFNNVDQHFFIHTLVESFNFADQGVPRPVEILCT